ncbi:PepSY-associated TM helix domain-containing protein [Mucilaginibacter rubeus]|uniref:PepSY domain-containing protein n=1 Tax=Mucilaginibacter rubeus TaxID=2027860 RepID=A0A5C1I216_9SPHI|nr:PepSY-associated TM helix domain-containing protein [Mucilaginibacter rubeus]QEM11350.1 PepSY domain-containing protein [Mucilaginibacter rubeus]
MLKTATPAKAVKPKKKGDSMFKRISAWLHLWLGLFSGIIVVIVSITGAIYVFEKEIRSVTEPWTHVQPQNKKMLPPSALTDIAVKTVSGMKPTALNYGLPDQSAAAVSYSRKTGLLITVFIDPYSGRVLKKTTTDFVGNKGDFDFFRFILHGHRALWLPYPIGRPIIGVAILIFVVLLLSGLVLWWPKKWTKATRDKSFKVKWNASFKRVNYDLHNVFGFYSMLLLLIIALTGLVWSFQWVSKSVYWATSGGKSLTEETAMVSDTTTRLSFNMASVDKLWNQIAIQDKPEGFYINLPRQKADLVEVIAYLRSGTYYKTNIYNFDQYTLKPIKSAGPYSGRYADAGAADKLRRMNYDIHVGAILGIPGKVVAFFLAMVSASLPITGFYIWWGKRNKKPAVKQQRPKKVQPELVIQ